MDINLTAPINQLGYGVSALNILKALMQKGHNVCLYGIPPLDVSYHDIPLINQAQVNCFHFNPNAPSLRIYHQNDMALHAGRGLHIGLPIFELNRFTDIEMHHLRSLDYIFVPSNWAKTVLEDHGFNNVWITPFGVDRSIFNGDVPSQASPDTVFLNCGKWEIRKGHDVLLEAFNKAFESDDNVKLIMHCHNPFIGTSNTDWERRYMNSKLGKQGKIRISNHRFKTQQELAMLMANADCGVFPARAEGWNLEALEMLSMGKTLITTNYSAHTEYATNYNSLLIDFDKLEPAEDGIWFRKQGEWGHFGQRQIDRLINLLRMVHGFKQMGGLSINDAGIQTAEKFIWEATADKIVEGFDYVGRTRNQGSDA